MPLHSPNQHLTSIKPKNGSRDTFLNFIKITEYDFHTHLMSKNYLRMKKQKMSTHKRMGKCCFFIILPFK